jgi:hypothetical protein
LPSSGLVMWSGCVISLAHLPRLIRCRSTSRSWVKPAAGGRGYRFHKLGKVETLRFVELCKSYSSDESLRGMRLIDRMLPLDEWEPDDGAEMEAMLEKAARPHEPWI